jgi:glucokinase
MILAGDTGGTNTRLALFEKIEQGFESVAVEKFSSPGFGSLNEIIEKFLADKPHKIERACFAVPGPVRENKAKLANLPWAVDANEVKKQFGYELIGLINDLESNAYGLSELKESDFSILNEGSANPTGNAALISAGTGLGQAGMHFSNGSRRPFASEGGHADFAPRSELEIELLRYLLGKYERVSVERVVSGMGLQNIYEFLRDTKREEVPSWLAEEITDSKDVGAIVSKHGLACKAPICEQTLEIFASLYGAETGNLGLKMLATGGVYIGGGIAPKILPKLQEPTFLNSFKSKGRMSDLMERMPVRVVLNDNAALLGAAHFAYNEIKE